MLSDYKIYRLLMISIELFFWGNLIYRVRKYEIDDYSKLNKYKISKNNILIKLKLFKYDNRFNYLLIVPYLLTCGIFIITLILYIIYWCGVIELEMFIASPCIDYFYFPTLGVLAGYWAIIDYLILGSYTPKKYDFPEDKMNDDAEEKKKDFISKEL